MAACAPSSIHATFLIVVRLLIANDQQLPTLGLTGPYDGNEGDQNVEVQGTFGLEFSFWLIVYDEQGPPRSHVRRAAQRSASFPHVKQ
ncbi:hypothetical protein HYDPIDRAFT_44364 [Hydnomerulius pinastri MD-312]|uniref:Secreted protein n=1 Tax=Hydnomerulius pinastri MD-312 TaxID=994086 RepID=A0A0C9W7D3_9AGAM|nr:hypothetical protein HYDPIDRAFT_44364 [Hydnomerulius pinastri MD-312]